MKLFPLNLVLKCEVVLNSHTKCQSGPHQAILLWTRPCRAKPWPASSNQQVKSVLFWGTTPCRVKIPYRRFRTTYRPHFQTTKNSKKRTQHDWY